MSIYCRRILAVARREPLNMGCEESRDGEYWDSIPVGVLCGKPGTERADVLIVGRFPTILCDDCYAYWKETHA